MDTRPRPLGARRLLLPVATGLALLGIALLGVAWSGGKTDSVKEAACTLFAAPDGRPAADGSMDDPLDGPRALTSRLRSGQVGCLRAGRYRFDRPLRITEPLTTLRSAPGERATLRGAIRVEVSARGTQIRQLRLDGRNPQRRLGPLIYADRTVLRGNEITNANAPMICVHVDRYRGAERPTGVRIVGNEIHECGQLPRTNYHHGIYLGSSRDAVVRGNWIHDNADRGVQLYPNADGTRVIGNRVERNGQGIAFGGAGGQAADRSVVTGNVIRASRAGYEVGSSYPTGSRAGRANSVSLNCLIGAQVFSGSAGYVSAANAVLDRRREGDGVVEAASRSACEARALERPAAQALGRIPGTPEAR